MAFDKSLRSFDHEGRLHVELTPLSKANICPYFGWEIPKSQELGLDQQRVYHLFRDDAELRRAADTSNNIQLMQSHEIVTPDQPKKMHVVGSTGTDAIFSMPYLKNSLVVWDQKAIDLIVSNRKKQLSCAYHYDADMTPGTYLGHPYDGRMINIRLNHVALVEDGRAGADVLVADEMPAELAYDSMPFELTGDPRPMTTPAISQRSLVARGALTAFLKPRLAADAALDYKAVLLGTTVQNWATAKPIITARVHEATRGRLAKDANLDGLELALDSLDDVAEDEWPDKDDDEDKSKAKDKKAKDAHDPDAEDEKDAKDKKAKDAKDKKAKDAAADDEDGMDKAKDTAKDKFPAKDSLEPTPITKSAMDSAIEAAVSATENRMRDNQRALREAEEIVQPLLGKIIAQDSASDVYGLLFKHEGVDVKDVPPAAFKVLAQQIVKGHTKTTQHKATLAVDHSVAKNFATRFPGAAAIRSI